MTSSDISIEDEWFLPKITDYFEWENEAFIQNALRFSKARSLSRGPVSAAIRDSIEKHVNALDDKQLVSAAFIIVEDLYKNVIHNLPPHYIANWKNSVEMYLAFAGQFFFQNLSKRSLRIRYIIDNNYENTSMGLLGPIVLFPRFFGTAGLEYISPYQQVYLNDQKVQTFSGHENSIDSNLIEANRNKFQETVLNYENEKKNYVVLEIESDEQNLNFLKDLINVKDETVITVWRREWPNKGSKSILLHKHFVTK